MNKNSDRVECTKQDLREAFWRLYAKSCALSSSRDPLKMITVKDVVNLAGYNRATFYSHYRDIYDLLDEIEFELLRSMTKCVESCMVALEGDASKIACIIELGKIVSFYEKNKAKISVLLGPNGDSVFIARLKEELKPLLRQYIITDEYLVNRTEKEIDLIYEYTLNGTLFMITKWLSEPNGLSANDMGHLVYDLAIKEIPMRIA